MVYVLCPFQICPSSCSLHLSTVDVHAPCPLGGPAHETLAGITHDICMLLETRVNVRCVLTDFSKIIDPLFTVSARFLILVHAWIIVFLRQNAVLAWF